MPSSPPSNWNALLTAAHAWQLSPENLPPTELERHCLNWLTPPELVHHQKLRAPALRHNYLAARALCRATLSRYAAVPPSDWKFTARKNGKPRIISPSSFAKLRFNLTHTDGLVICLVTRVGEVGIDAEETTRKVNIDQVARHFFSASEQAALADLPPDQRPNRFFQFWVLKEAYLKGCGAGLSKSPGSFSVEIDAHGRAAPLRNWQLTIHSPTPNHVAAAAIQRKTGYGGKTGYDPVSIHWHEMNDLFVTGIPIKK